MKAMILEDIFSRNYRVSVTHKKEGGGEMPVFVIQDKLITANWTSFSGDGATAKYKKIKRFLRSGKSSFFDRECYKLINDKNTPVAPEPLKSGNAALTVKLYAGDVLIRESIDASLWTMVMGEILENAA